jgi:glycogen debranching enzyme
MEKRNFSRLWNLAEASLTANVASTDQGLFLAAGGHQFGSLWTRDFCFAARGLIAAGRSDVVASHLSLLLELSRPEDGLVPRVLESVPSWKRVIAHTALRTLPGKWKRMPIRSPLFAEYEGEHGTISMDSNALVLRAVHDFVTMTGDRSWLEAHRPGIERVLGFCLSRTEGGRTLARQGRFEDWQDSSSREGHTFYVNFLILLAFDRMARLGFEAPAGTSGLRQQIAHGFFEDRSSLPRSHAQLASISLDGALLLLTEEMPMSEASSLDDIYLELRRHPIWTRAEIPGVATFPDYPKSWISWTTKIVGLRHYHDQLLWTWLSALAAKAACQLGDLAEARRILQTLEALAIRDGGLGEIHEPASGLPLVKTWLYRSELPFSWSAGATLEALSAYRSHETL